MRCTGPGTGACRPAFRCAAGNAAQDWAKEHTAAIGPNPTSTSKVVIVTYGGSYQAGLDTAFFQPFAEQMHITVEKFAGDNIDVLNRSRQEVASGHPVYDLTSTNQTYYQQGVADNLWEPIDYSVFNPDDLRAIPDKMRLKYGVGTIVYSNNLVFNTQAFASGSAQPTSWADFWDVQKFPGKRAMPFCDKATADKLPTNPDILGQTFQNDEKWWLDNRDKWVAACKAAVGQ